MKKIIIFSTLIVTLLVQATAFAGTRPRGHKSYLKHSKHHKAHKLHKSHGVIDATYN